MIVFQILFSLIGAFIAWIFYCIVGTWFYKLVLKVNSIKIKDSQCDYGVFVNNMYGQMPSFATTIWPIMFLIWLIGFVFYMPIFVVTALS